MTVAPCMYGGPIDPVRRRVAVHEAAHAIVAVLLGWRLKLVRIGVHGGGLVDVFPSSAVARYRDPAVAPLLMFLMADAEAFRNGGYDGPPLPTALPPGGLRVVADIVAVLLAGFASEADPATSYRRVLAVEGSDARQIAVLIERYPSIASVRDNLLAWMPGFLAGEMADAVNAIADALLNPTDAALASSLGSEDVDRVMAGIDEQQVAKAARRINAQLDGLCLLASAANWAA